MPFCPCCSHQLIRQISRQRLYWFCSPCHQEMPNLSQLNWVGKAPTSVSGEFGKPIAPGNTFQQQPRYISSALSIL